MAENNQSNSSTMSDVRRALYRHKCKAVCFFLAVMGTVTLITIFAPKIYRSEGKLFVRLGRENVALDPTATLGEKPIITVPLTRENEINSVVEILRGRVVIEKVVDAIGPEAILDQHDEPGEDDPVVADSSLAGWFQEASRQAKTVAAEAIDRLKQITSAANRN